MPRSRYVGNMCISTGEYEKDGQKKKSWMTIGKVFQSDKGNYSVYLPLFDKWAAIFFSDNQKNNGWDSNNSNQSKNSFNRS